MARILVWSERTWPTPGGAELLAILLPAALQALGHKIEIVASQLPGIPADEIVSGLQVRRVSIPQQATADQLGTIAASMARTREIITRFQPEIMLLIQPLALLMFYAATRRFYPAISVFCLHAHLEAEWSASQLTGQMIRASDYVVSCSDVVLSAAREQIPEIIPKSETIRNALPSTNVMPAPLPWAEPRFLCLGRLSPEKNFATALRAFARIAGNYPSARLTISGDGPEMGALRGLAVELGIAQQVDFTGWIAQSEVYGAINQATAVIVPSLSEGLPLVGIQALQMGRPVIGAAIDGLLETISDGESGFLFEPIDDSALAEIMTRLLENQQLTVTMGQSARRRADTVFDWSVYVQRYDQMIERMILSHVSEGNAAP